MCRHLGPLQTLVAHEIARRTGSGCGCGCVRCRQPPTDAWGGWSPAVSLAQLRQAQGAASASGQPAGGGLGAFLTSGQPRLYRILRVGIDRDRPLSIGMTGSRRSVAERIWEHYRRPDRGDLAVHAAIRNLQPAQILVQIGRARGPITVPRAQGYQAWLRERERPLVDPQTRTFETASAWS